MKIQEIRIKKFKKLENIEQELKGNHILLLGDNGVGKTSVIQFIEIALGKTGNIPPFAEGAGEVVVNKDGNLITFRVDFKEGKPVIKVKGNGISIDNKKSAIAELVGAVEFDIEHFVGLSKTKAGRAEQVKIFKSFLPKSTQEELAKFEANVKNHESERTEIGRDITKLKGMISLHELNYLPDFELEKYKPTDTAEVMAKLKAANESNSKITTVENGITEKRGKISDKTIEIAELQAKINKLNGEIEVLETEINKGKEWLKSHSVLETASLEKMIQDADMANLDYSKAQSLLSERKKLSVFEDEYNQATEKIKSDREAIANTIRDEDAPIQGLGYDDQQLVYNGMPVNPDVLSKSEIMELGLKLKLAENPSLGILFIPEAESLGSERFLMLKEIADKNNCQLIAEQVQRGTKELHFEIMTDELITV